MNQKLILTFAGVLLSITRAGSGGAEPPPGPGPASPALAEGLLADLEDLYRDLHARPELSLKEERTSGKMAARLRALGFEVTERVGGWGVVGVLRNGEGPVVMLRTDLDALPVEEKTGLPYASRERSPVPGGESVPVMHACGHDVHMTCWVGAATVLSRTRSTWRGTLLLVAQPAAEGGGGARAMLRDGLFTRW